jgi:hypothetical protein
LAEISRVPQKFRARLAELVDSSVTFAASASGVEGEKLARMAALVNCNR